MTFFARSTTYLLQPPQLTGAGTSATPDGV
jgi:hypothetical protein